jgi:hypothetical protein
MSPTLEGIVESKGFQDKSNCNRSVILPRGVGKLLVRRLLSRERDKSEVNNPFHLG